MGWTRAGAGVSRGFRTTNVAHAPQKDLYQILGVQKDATAAEVKKAYLKLVSRYGSSVSFPWNIQGFGQT
jgi:hypothetical protein